MAANFNPAGLGLALICVLIVILQFGLHKWTKKVRNYYFYWAGIATFMLIWVLIYKFIPNWQRYASRILDPTSYSDCHIISNAFLLDACPASVIIMSILLIVDPTRKAARSFAPIALLGGAMITLIQMPFFDEAEWSLRFIFMGTSLNPCYFLYHAYNMIISIGVMLNTPKFKLRGYLACVACYGTYYSYVAIVAAITGCQYFVSGLNLNDWTSMGQYHIVAEILHCSPQVAMPLGLIALPLVASGFIAINDYAFHRWIWRYGNAYSGKWYRWYDYDKYQVVKFI